MKKYLTDATHPLTTIVFIVFIIIISNFPGKPPKGINKVLGLSVNYLFIF